MWPMHLQAGKDSVYVRNEFAAEAKYVRCAGGPIRIAGLLGPDFRSWGRARCCRRLCGSSRGCIRDQDTNEQRNAASQHDLTSGDVEQREYAQRRLKSRSPVNSNCNCLMLFR